jgi:hypothetical protein
VDSEFIQLLTPEGELLEHPEYAAELSDDEYRALYRDLTLVRRFDVEAAALQRPPSSGLMKPKPLSALNHFTVPVVMSAPSQAVRDLIVRTLTPPR